MRAAISSTSCSASPSHRARNFKSTKPIMRRRLLQAAPMRSQLQGWGAKLFPQQVAPRQSLTEERPHEHLLSSPQSLASFGSVSLHPFAWTEHGLRHRASQPLSSPRCRPSLTASGTGTACYLSWFAVELCPVSVQHSILALSILFSLAYIHFYAPELDQVAGSLPPYPDPMRRTDLYLVAGELHHQLKPLTSSHSHSVL